MRSTQRLAIFDIDGTLFRSSLVIEVFHGLVDAGVFPTTAGLRIERSFVKWLDRKGHYNDYIMTLVREFHGNLKGKKAASVLPVVSRVIRRQKDRVYRFTRDLVAALHRRGYFLLAVSNSPEFIVRPFSAQVGLDDCIGRTYEVKAGRYTGHLTVNGRPIATHEWMDKVALLSDFFKRRGVKIDLKRSFAVGDSEGDIPLLSAVGHPIAFNPSAELALEAQKRGWQVVVERKDVMYLIGEAGMIMGKEKQKIKIRHISHV